MQLAVYISSIIQQTVAIGSYGGGGHWDLRYGQNLLAVLQYSLYVSIA